MGHTITGKLNKDARMHPLDDSTIFFISVGERNYNRKSKEYVWTNYDVGLFAKGGQIDFYQNALVEGTVVSVTGTGIIMVKQEGQDANGMPYKDKLALQDSKLTYVYTGQAPQQQPRQTQQQPAQQAGFQQPAQQQPQQQAQSAPIGMDSFDDDIPF